MEYVRIPKVDVGLLLALIQQGECSATPQYFRQNSEQSTRSPAAISTWQNFEQKASNESTF
jgi:hypothetical protein